MSKFDELMDVLKSEMDDSDFLSGNDNFNRDPGNFDELEYLLFSKDSAKQRPLTFLEEPMYLADTFGGYEGAGEEMWYIIEFEGRFIRVSGTYDSWDSNYWHDVREVFPEEYVAVRWQDKKKEK